MLHLLQYQYRVLFRMKNGSNHHHTCTTRVRIAIHVYTVYSSPHSSTEQVSIACHGHIAILFNQGCPIFIHPWFNIAIICYPRTGMAIWSTRNAIPLLYCTRLHACVLQYTCTGTSTQIDRSRVYENRILFSYTLGQIDKLRVRTRVYTRVLQY